MVTIEDMPQLTNDDQKTLEILLSLVQLDFATREGLINFKREKIRELVRSYGSVPNFLAKTLLLEYIEDDVDDMIEGRKPLCWHFVNDVLNIHSLSSPGELPRMVPLRKDLTKKDWLETYKRVFNKEASDSELAYLSLIGLYDEFLFTDIRV